MRIRFNENSRFTKAKVSFDKGQTYDESKEKDYDDAMAEGISFRKIDCNSLGEIVVSGKALKTKRKPKYTETSDRCFDHETLDTEYVSVDELKDFLMSKDNNTVDTPYNVRVTSIYTSDALQKMTDTLRLFPNIYLNVSPTELNVTDISNAFAGCSNVTEVTVPNNVEQTQYSFYDCDNLSLIDIPDDMTTISKGMFYGCKNLTNLDLSSFNTSNLVNMRSMFTNCTNLVTIDLSSFDTSKVDNVFSLFRYDKNLTTIYVSNKFDISGVTGVDTDGYLKDAEIFSSCTKLVGGNGTTYSVDHVGKDYAVVDMAYYDETGSIVSGTPGYLTLRNVISSEYERVSYIETSKTQYITTDITIGDIKDKYTMDIEFEALSLYDYNIEDSYEFVKKNFNYLDKINLEEIKKIKFSWTHDTIVLLKNGNLLINGKKKINGIKDMVFINGSNIFVITNEYQIISVLNESTSSLIFNNKNYKYKKIYYDYSKIIALTYDGKLKIYGDLLGEFIDSDRLTNIQDIGVSMDGKDDIVVVQDGLIYSLFSKIIYKNDKNNELDVIVEGEGLKYSILVNEK